MQEQGVVISWRADKGYGFLSRDAGGANAFVHANDLPRGWCALPVGQRVSFALTDRGRGPCAIDVVVLDEDGAME